jgi:hypothetical protein
MATLRVEPEGLSAPDQPIRLDATSAASRMVCAAGDCDRLYPAERMAHPAKLSVGAAFTQLCPLSTRAYAHYVMSAVPFIVVILWHGASEIPAATFRWRGGCGRLWWSAAASVVGLSIACGAYVKRRSLLHILRPANADPVDMARQICRCAPARSDRALFLTRGPLGYHTSAGYYYTGLRPPWPYLVMFGMYSDEMQRWIDRLPQIIADPDTKVVVFDPNAGFSSLYFPIQPELRDKIAEALRADFVHPDETNDPNLWVRRQSLASDGVPLRGPFAVPLARVEHSP